MNKVSDVMVERALKAWFKYTHLGWERAMKEALTTALNEEENDKS